MIESLHSQNQSNLHKLDNTVDQEKRISFSIASVVLLVFLLIVFLAKELYSIPDFNWQSISAFDHILTLFYYLIRDLILGAAIGYLFIRIPKVQKNRCVYWVSLRLKSHVFHQCLC